MFYRLLIVCFTFCIPLASVASSHLDDCDIQKVRGELTMYPDVYLDGPYSIEQLENAHLVSEEKNGQSVNIPFGRINADWELFKSMMTSADCILFFNTGGENPGNLFRVKGYFLVRENIIIRYIITGIS